MLFRIRTISGKLVHHPQIINKDDVDIFYHQEVELNTLDDLLKLQKDLGEGLIVRESDWDNPELPIQVNDTAIKPCSTF